MRWAVLGYGCVAYFLFVRAILYFAGFTGNLFVPKSVDSGSEGDLATAVTVDLLLMLLFAVSHSLMARQGFKDWQARHLPVAVERSTYVLLSSLVLSLLFWQWRPVTGVVWETDSPALRRLLLVLFGSGWLISLLSSHMLGHLDMFGLRQVYCYFRGEEYKPIELRTGFFYRYVRHPMYLGSAIGMWSASRMTFGHLLFSAGMTVYLVVGAWFEEMELQKRYGEPYLEYRQRSLWRARRPVR